MEATTILNMLKESPSKDTFEKCIDYCISHDYSFKDENLREIYIHAVSYLMRTKCFNLTEDEAKLLINFFSKTFAGTLKLDDSIKVKILDEQEYRDEYGNDSNAICIKNDDIHTVSYSPNVVKQLMSGTPKKFLRGMQTIFHEVAHVFQNNTIYGKGIHYNVIDARLSMYIQVVETIARRVDPNFYKLNYKNIYKENHAEYVGLSMAMDYIKKFNIKLYNLFDLDAINKRLEAYQASMNSSLTLFGYESSHLKALDYALCLYVEKHPDVFEEFPLLEISFNKDGKKKSLTELLQDRRTKLDKYSSRKELDTLYEALCIDQNVMVGGLQGTKEQLKELVDYTEKYNLDYFEYKIFEKKLSHKDLPDNIRKQILNWASKYRLPDDDPPPMGMVQ